MLGSFASSCLKVKFLLKYIHVYNVRKCSVFKQNIKTFSPKTQNDVFVESFISNYPTKPIILEWFLFYLTHISVNLQIHKITDNWWHRVFWFGYLVLLEVYDIFVVHNSILYIKQFLKNVNSSRCSSWKSPAEEEETDFSNLEDIFWFVLWLKTSSIPNNRCNMQKHTCSIYPADGSNQLMDAP